MRMALVYTGFSGVCRAMDTLTAMTTLLEIASEDGKCTGKNDPHHRGTGSFGRAAANRFLENGFREIRIFSRDELKQEQMRQWFNDLRLKMNHRRPACPS